MHIFLFYYDRLDNRPFLDAIRAEQSSSLGPEFAIDASKVLYLMCSVTVGRKGK